MATNIFQKGKKFAATALALLQREVKAPGLFTTKYGIADFTGAEGDVINVRRPAVLVAREKGWRTDEAIVVDKLVQTKIQIKLDRHPYSAVALSSEEATLDEVDYVRDVQAPQVLSLLEWFENLVVGALAAAKFIFAVNFDPNGTGPVADPRKVAIKARKYFQRAKVPTTGRYWLVGSDVSEAIAGHDKLLEVDTSGLPEALRDGVVGKLGGFIIVELDALDYDESYFVHETAIAIAAVAPAVPNGAAKGGGVAAGMGLAVTQIWDYDGATLKDRSVVHAFAGATPVLDPEVTEDGMVLEEDGTPHLEFYRGIKVIFGTPATTTSTTWTSAVTGTPTGGTYTLSVDGAATEPIAYNATGPEIVAALDAIDGVAGVTIKGTATKTLTFTEPVLVTAAAALTGGTTPGVTVTKV